MSTYQLRADYEAADEALRGHAVAVLDSIAAGLIPHPHDADLMRHCELRRARDRAAAALDEAIAEELSGA